MNFDGRTAVRPIFVCRAAEPHGLAVFGEVCSAVGGAEGAASGCERTLCGASR